MSIKVYNAYKVPLSKLNEFCFHVQKEVFQQAEQKYLDLIITLLKKDWSDYEIYDKFREQSSNPLKSMFCLDSGVSIFIKEKYCYFVFFFSKINIGQFKLPLYAEKFDYWNNADKEESVTDEEWKHREEIWEEILYYPRLQYDIIDYKVGVGTDCFTNAYLKAKKEINNE